MSSQNFSIPSGPKTSSSVSVLKELNALPRRVSLKYVWTGATSKELYLQTMSYLEEMYLCIHGTMLCIASY